MVQILDAPVAQMVEQLPNLVQFFDTLMPEPEQDIEVPKILPFDVPMRAALRVTQLGGTAGGSADDNILFLVAADCGAERRHSSSSSWRAKRWSSRFSLLNKSSTALHVFSGTNF